MEDDTNKAIKDKLGDGDKTETKEAPVSNFLPYYTHWGYSQWNPT